MSIRLRLTLWYTGLLALALILFGGFLYFFMNYTLHSELEASLQQRAQEVLVGLTSGSARSLDVFAAPDTFVQIVQVNGNSVAFVTGQTSNLSANGVQLPVPDRFPASGRYDTEQVLGEPLRVYTRPVVNGSNQLVFLIQVGRILSPIDTTMHRLRLVLLLAGFGVLGLAALLGWTLQDRALAPIARITAAAQAIGRSGDLSQRVNHEGPDDELGHLATTFNAMLDGLEASRHLQQEAYNAQRRFVADASHELRTPLTIIRGNLNLLERSLKEAAPDVREALTDMLSETQAMSVLVSDLLTLARADAGVHLERVPTALGPVLEEAAHRTWRLAADKGVAFVPDIAAAQELRLRGSADHLLRLCSILLENAVKYTPAGGSVRLSARPDEGGVRISVTDTGVGIAPDHLPHVFERFYRGGKPQQEGSGLGLAIAHWIADEHEGRITVVSQVGQGSSFSLWLPLL